jgi:outer membrane protein assembly factor BamB
MGGELVALDAATGAPRWRRALAEGHEPTARGSASPVAIADGVVYGGVLRDVGAFDLATGAPRWRLDAAREGGDATTAAGPALAGDLVLVVLGRGWSGVAAYDRATGAEVWRAPDVGTGAQGTPLVVGDLAYVVDWEGEVVALDARDGTPRWRRRVVDDAAPWGYASAAPPVANAGTLLVATMAGGLVALDADDGEPRWTFEPGPARVPLAHYPVSDRGANLAPVVAGGALWLAGVDGVVHVLDPTDGAERRRFDLGAPVLAAPVADGDALVVATLDGVVRALPLALAAGPAPDGARPSGGPSAWQLALALLLGALGLAAIAQVARRRRR